MVQFCERTVNKGSFHEAFLQCADAGLYREDTRQSADLAPGDLKFARKE